MKIADNTYTYSFTIDPSKWKGTVNFTLDAKTIYINGKTAGQTHTSAVELKQSFTVPVVISTTEDLTAAISAQADGETWIINAGTYDINEVLQLLRTSL